MKRRRKKTNKNHGDAKYPTPRQIKNVRKRLQQERQLGVTDAQEVCARMVYSGTRTWQQWENGDRRMHPGLWDLLDRVYVGREI